MVQKLIVGLTGGLGTGKTTVVHLFEELGAFTVNADSLAHEALLEGSPVYEEIKKIFPQAATAGGFDRKKIAAVIFKDTAKRKALEGIVHPYVFSRIEEEINNAEEKVVLIEVPLLFESGMDRICDRTIAVRASSEAVKKRLAEKGFTEEDMKARQAAQMPVAEKEKRAGTVLDNSGTLDQTRREVEKIWKDLHAMSLKKGER